MKRVLIYSVLFANLFASTINIPADYSTIQEGIDASVDGDTVLIAQGTYYENLILENEIVLASHAINDDLNSDWLNNVNIQETIISGALEPVDPNKGSCLVIRDGNIAPTILGLTFQDGIGTAMVENDNCAIEINRPERSGGAILIFKAYPTIMYNRFLNNGFSHDTGGNNPTNIEVANGGAIGHYSSEDVEFDEDRNNSRRNRHSSRDIPEELNIQNNYFENNGSGDGKNFYSRGYEGSIDVSYSIFDDIDCASNSVNKYVLKSRNDYAEYLQNEISGNCIEENSFYVSVDGDNNNPGTVSDPLKTIGHALSLVRDDTTITTTIYIREGIYSPSTTGEQFPIVLPENVHLIGDNRENSILDAEADSIRQRRVLIIERCENVRVAKLTITGGYAESAACYGGGGIFICPPNPRFWDYQMSPSTPVLEDLIVTGNHAYAGGGISIWEQDGPSLSNIIISENTATWLGGGIMIAASVAYLDDVSIFGNSATEGEVLYGTVYPGSGGGIYMDIGDSEMNRVRVFENIADRGAGLSIWNESNLLLTNSIFYGNHSETSGGGIDPFGLTGNVTISNSIFWDNIPTDVSLSYISSTITYSNINWEDEGNIIADPLFTDAENGDFTLQQGSPCIDAGTADLDGDGIEDITDYFGTAPDMGAFEYFIAGPTGLQFTIEDASVMLTWEPIAEVQYYLIERSTDSLFNTDLVANYVQENFFTDNNLEWDIEYYYRVAAYTSFWSLYSDVISVTLEWMDIDNERLATSYVIHQNYPNPFNPATTIRYDLPEVALVKIIIYDMMGRKVSTLISSQQSAGYKSVQWNATNDKGAPVSAGLYLYTIQAGEFRQTKKMVLLK